MDVGGWLCLSPPFGPVAPAAAAPPPGGARERVGEPPAIKSHPLAGSKSDRAAAYFKAS